MKVAHCLGKFDRGGVEVLLKEVFLKTQKEEADLSFILMSKEEGVFDNELLSNGGILNKFDIKQGYFKFFLGLFKLLKREKYDVVHSHHQSFSGFIMLISFLAGVKVRIAHSHNDEVYFESKANVLRKCYVKFMKLLIVCFANKKLACSSKAGISLFGNNNAFEVIKNGVNSSKFKCFNEEERIRLFSELNIPSNAKIIGHVGRFDEQKNHKFIIDMASKVIQHDSKMYFVLVGTGSLFEEIKLSIEQNNLQHNIILLGGRNDIPNLMVNLFDLFLFPSLYEGLGIVLLESQLSGLYSIVSENIVEEAIVFNEMVLQLDLSQGSEYWSEKIFENINKSNKSGDYMLKFSKSDYVVDATVQKFILIYKSLM